MRNNNPVTQQEFEFPSSQMLVSATDLTGRIEYCNPAFIAVSGYAKDELVGQPELFGVESRFTRHAKLATRRRFTFGAGAIALKVVRVDGRTPRRRRDRHDL
ncbi:PAS domain S-box protein [Paraburkholderia sp. IMGN_8]|uniref:PAS domain S-box protein n=1 Tax=Paraburkholderia sp. IMGN_8 TaxID=3136564 RepID=UPI00310168C2